MLYSLLVVKRYFPLENRTSKSLPERRISSTASFGETHPRVFASFQTVLSPIVRVRRMNPMFSLGLQWTSVVVVWLLVFV